MSFFVICAFVTNEYIRTGVQQLPKTVNQSTDDIMLFLNNTQYEINTLLRTNFNQLEQELGDSLDKSGLIVKNRLAVLSEAASLENLTDIVSSESFIIKSYNFFDLFLNIVNFTQTFQRIGFNFDGSQGIVGRNL